MRAGVRFRRFPGSLLQQVDRTVQLRIEIAAQDFEDFDEGAIADGVIDLVAGFAADYDLFGPKHGQVLRGIRLLNAELFDQLSSGSLPIPEELYDCNPRRIRKALENFALELAEGVVHVCLYIRILAYSTVDIQPWLHQRGTQPAYNPIGIAWMCFNAKGPRLAG